MGLKVQQAKVRLKKIHSKSYSEFMKKTQTQKERTHKNTWDEYSYNHVQEESKTIPVNQQEHNLIPHQLSKQKDTNSDQKSSGLSPILKPIEEFECSDLVGEEQDLQELRYLRSLVAYQASKEHAKFFQSSYAFFQSCCSFSNETPNY